ncbi:unnamed protein product, partial [Staurois parvus]
MSLFVIFKFPAARSVPVRPDVAGNRTRKTDAGIRLRTLQGTLQEGHRGSAGQGKGRTDPGAAPHGKPSVAQGYRLCYTREYHQGGY